MITAHHAAQGWFTADGPEPGTLFLLEQGEAPEFLVPLYRAVLACPACGALGLITRAQYEGRVPILCAAPACPAEYTLRDDQVYFRRAQ